MAKRKRLSAANPAFLVPSDDITPNGPFAAPALPPIAGVAGDASATAALEELSRSVAEQRAAGMMVLELDLAQLDLDHLVRDRVAMAEDDMQPLMQSLSARGQQTPIEVMALGAGRYGLISGWRRSQALMRLARETGETRFKTVLALIRRPQDAPAAYQAMVEENEIRVALSHYERARIVVKSVEQGVFETEKKALQELFATASRSKRSKIGSFITVVRALDGALQFPAALGERLGLSLSKMLEDNNGFTTQLRTRLIAQLTDDAAAEKALIEREIQSLNIELDTKNLESSSATDLRSKTPEVLVTPTSQGRKVALGVRLLNHPCGDLVLTGPGLTPEFRAALRSWLKTLT